MASRSLGLCSAASSRGGISGTRTGAARSDSDRSMSSVFAISLVEGAWWVPGATCWVFFCQSGRRRRRGVFQSGSKTSTAAQALGTGLSPQSWAQARPQPSAARLLTPIVPQLSPRAARDSCGLPHTPCHPPVRFPRDASSHHCKALASPQTALLLFAHSPLHRA